MADELKIQTQLIYDPSKQGLSGVDIGPYEKFVTVEGEQFITGSQYLEGGIETIGGDHELESIGYVFFHNIGTNDAILLIGSTEVIRLKPEDIAMFRVEGSVIQAKPAVLDSPTYLEFVFFEE